ncbi:hypothetical protein [Piscibacillus salipiscarius]|nr:hypothetical protein [Piscibacillus salipiscarius]
MKASNIEKSSPKISNISFDNHHLMIEIDFKERTEQLLVINRETQEEYYIDQTSNFTYKLNLSMFNQSTWDFYIKNKDNHYRIKTSDEKPLGESYIFYNNKTNSLMNIKPYKTVKGSFSLSILNDTVKLENLKTF